MRFVFGCVLFVALSIASWGDECARPLSDYCAPGECPTLEEAAIEPGWYVDDIFACGDTQGVVGDRNVETGWARYFDESGELATAE